MVTPSPIEPAPANRSTACRVTLQGDTLGVQHRQRLGWRLVGVPFLLMGGYIFLVACLLVWSHVQAASLVTQAGRWLPGWLLLMALAALMLFIGFNLTVATRWVTLRTTDGHIDHHVLRHGWLWRRQAQLSAYGQVRLVAYGRKLGKSWPQDPVQGHLGASNLKLVLVPRAAQRPRGLIDPDFDSLANAPPWQPMDPNTTPPSLVLAEGDLGQHAELREAAQMVARVLGLPFHHRVPMCLLRWKRANRYKNF
jgi:hypothetical protein